MEYLINATRQTTVSNNDGTTSEERVPVTIGLRATINPVTQTSDSDSEPYAGQVYAYPGTKITAQPFNEEDGNFIKTNGLDIVKTDEIDKLFTIMCESGNSFFDNYFVLNVVECPETQDLCQQLSKGSGANTKLFKIESLKTIFYPYPFRCSIVSNILKFIDCGTVRRVTTERDRSDRCVICISNYDLGQDTRTLPCLHKFHRKCIDEWIVHDRCCPFCRLKIQFCGHKQCKIITVDSNFSNDFEVQPAASPPSPPPPVQNNPSAVEEDDLDRMFNLSFGDLDMLSNEEIDLGTFRDTVQAILNIASERHNVDVVAMFEALQPGMASLVRPRTANAARVSSSPRTANEGNRRAEASNTTPNSGFRVPAEGFRRDAPTVPTHRHTNNPATEGPSVKRQKNDQSSTGTIGASSSTVDVLSKPKQVYVQADAMSPWILCDYCPKMDNQPAPLPIENQAAQNEPTTERSMEFDSSSNSDTVEIDVTGLSQGSASTSEPSSCDEVHLEHHTHTTIVENCICCNQDNSEKL